MSDVIIQALHLCYVSYPLVKGISMELGFKNIVVVIITAVDKDGGEAAGIRRAVHWGGGWGGARKSFWGSIK